jgi:O-antigen/teichoic acid export membrane protein
MISVRLLMGLLGYSQTGLMFSYFAGYFVGTVLLIYNLDFKLRNKYSIRDLKKVFIRYISFLKYSLFSDTLSVLASTSPNVLLNNVFGSTSAGYFSLSEKVLGSPIWLITSSVSDVFKQEFSEQNREGKDCKILFLKTFKTLLFLGLIPFSLIFLLTPFVISPLLGEVWSPVGEYIRIFSIMYYSSFVVNPLKSVAYIIKKQQYMIAFELLKLIALVVAFSVGYYLSDLRVALILWSCLITCVNIIVFLIIYRLVLNISNERKNTKDTKNI